MNRFSSAAGLALAALAVMGLAGPAAAGEQVPFKGRLKGAFTVTSVSPPIVNEIVTGTGNATHLGKFTWVLALRVDVSTTPALLTGTFQFKAANGDTVYGTFSGTASPTPNPDVVSFVEAMTITGGTGRFAGAAGGFTLQGLVNLVTTETTGSFTGTISSPGAAKRP